MAIDQQKQDKEHWFDVGMIMRDGKMMSKMEIGEDPCIKAISLDGEAVMQRSRKI